jgi:hypothetical protein
MGFTTSLEHNTDRDRTNANYHLHQEQYKQRPIF